MVKGNKFKTPEFLQQQALKAKAKQQAKAATSHQTDTAENPERVLVPQIDVQQNGKHSQAKPGQKRKVRPEVVLKDTSTNSNSAAAAAVAVSPVQKKRKTLKEHQQQQQQHQKRLPEPAVQQPDKLVASTTKMHKVKKAVAAVPTILAIPAAQGKAVNSNWAALKGILANPSNRKHPAKGNPAADRPPALKAPQQLGRRAGLTPVVAIDCEMVGVGPDGSRSALARYALLLGMRSCSQPCFLAGKRSILLGQAFVPSRTATGCNRQCLGKCALAMLADFVH